MIADRIQEIRERLAKATPGSWRADARGWQVLSDHANICGLHDGHDSKYWREEGRDTGQGPPNADFIAHAPDDIEFLLAFAARKEDDVEKLVDILNSHGLLHEQTDQLEARGVETPRCGGRRWIDSMLAGGGPCPGCPDCGVETPEAAVEAVAHAIARERCNGQVYMDGRHNVNAKDRRQAREYVTVALYALEERDA